MLGKLHIYNPGNIRISSDTFYGEIKPSSDPQFKEFASNAYGYRAMFKVLDTYRKYGLESIEQILSRYSEDNVASYVNYVTQITGFASNEYLTNDKATLTAVVAAMSAFENAMPPNMREIENGWDLKENIETVTNVASGFGVIALASILTILIYNLKKSK